jgi:hypothetical protein
LCDSHPRSRRRRHQPERAVEGDLVVRPEGTICRELFLQWFSVLFFLEYTEELRISVLNIKNRNIKLNYYDSVLVAMECQMSMFHGTTARGWKGMNPFYFFMNPRPVYIATFIEKLPTHLTCMGGKSSHEVANYVQKVIASTLSYQYTGGFTRKDKYRELANNDDVVNSG